jgi:hypothetical protein
MVQKLGQQQVFVTQNRFIAEIYQCVAKFIRNFRQQLMPKFGPTKMPRHCHPWNAAECPTRSGAPRQLPWKNTVPGPGRGTRYVGDNSLAFKLCQKTAFFTLAILAGWTSRNNFFLLFLLVLLLLLLPASFCESFSWGILTVEMGEA